MSTDWYRSKVWNKNLEEEFNRKLSFKQYEGLRAQYIRVQAWELIKFDKSIAVKLLKRVIREYPDDWLNYSFAISDLGDIYYEEGKYDEAEKYYRKLYYHKKSDRRWSGEQRSGVKLVRTILVTIQKKKYDEAYEIISNFDLDIEFLKSLKFECCYVSAWLCKEMGKVEESKEYARKAELLSDPSPSAVMHPGVGDIHASKEELNLLNAIMSS